MPAPPVGANGSKLVALATGMVSAQNTVSARILIATSTAFTRALSVVPMISSQVTSTEITIAGTLIHPPATSAACRSGEASAPNASWILAISASALLSAVGKFIPSPRSSPTAWLDQPTATALAPTAYSRISAQPTIHAISSPMTA